jgi:molybdopterin-guanine dinucleotide biosynthesis protein A
VASERAIVAVLAGGAGSRLGGEKAAVDLAGSPLISYPLAAARAAGLQAVVVAKPGSRLPALGAEVLREPAEPRHPLCGVLAALGHAESGGHPAVLALACDMPFLTGELVGWLAELDGAVAVSLGGRPQPLIARWPVQSRPLVAAALAGGDSVSATLAALSPRVVADDELASFGDPERLLLNVNDPVELRAAAALLEG